MEMTLDTPTDEILMKDLIQHKAAALETLYHRYRAILRSIIMQVLHDDGEADDVLQDVLIQVWNRASAYSSKKGRLISWLSTLARRRAIDRLRQHSAYRRATDRYEVACNHPDKEISEIRTVERDAQRGDLNALLQRHIANLPERQRDVIRMTFYEGKSQREISQLTGTPLGTVKTRIELGVKKLSQSVGSARDKIV